MYRFNCIPEKERYVSKQTKANKQINVLDYIQRKSLRDRVNMNVRIDPTTVESNNVMALFRFNKFIEIVPH